jgi:ribose-phosphate pyrophosphokinase
MAVIDMHGSAPLIFGGNAGKHLSGEICRCLSLAEGRLEITRFSDGETGVKILDNVRGKDCYLVQPTSSPVNERLMELLLLSDAMRRASARQINILIPYFGYARQDRKDQGRVAISSKLVANLIASAGASRVVCLDLHTPQIQGFFDIPVDHLYGGPLLVQHLCESRAHENAVVVSPDVGNVKMARAYASRLDCPLAIIDKRRPRPNVSEVMNIIGDVRDRHCIVVDDIIDTAGTLCNAVEALVKAGALSVMACATHGVFSGLAIKRLEASAIKRVLVTNSICPSKDASCDKIEYVDIAPLLAETIHRIHHHLSLSEMFGSREAHIPSTRDDVLGNGA